MGNQPLSFTLQMRPPHSRYSPIDRKPNPQQGQSDSEIDQWDSSWKDVTHQNLYYRVEFGKFHTFRNQVTAEDVERYQVVVNEKSDFEKWKEIVHWRNNSPYLPKIEHFSLQNQGQVCVSQFEINLFVQRIPLRLVDLTDIPYPENLYFLLCVLKGFKYIFGSPFPLKSFRVTQSLVCVNKEGQVKVWLSPNLSDFEPVNEKNTTHETQQQIMLNLINLVQQNTDQRDYPYKFKQYLADKHIPINGDYNAIIQQLYTFAKDMKVSIPKYAFSVRDILSKEFLSLTKIQEENSFSHKPHVRNETSSIRRDQSMSILNALEGGQTQKKQLLAVNDASHKQFFPKEKTHGLASNNHHILSIHNFPLNNEPTNARLNNFQPQMHQNHLNANQYLNALPHFQSFPQSNHSLTDRIPPSSHNLNNHLMKINQIGSNNFMQYQQSIPVVSHQTFVHPPRSTSPENTQRTHSLDQTHRIQNPSIPKNHLPPIPPAPPGYRMVEKKIIHPVGFDPLKNKQIPDFNPSLGYVPSFKNPNQMIQYYNPSFKNIERVNSTRIPFQMSNQSHSHEINFSQRSIQKGSFRDLASTKRPQKISSRVQIERINKEGSQTGIGTQNQANQEMVKKASWFKNNLIKDQHEQKQVQRAVSNVKYFTKIDSEETLDPQIAGDLMKYLGRNS